MARLVRRLKDNLARRRRQGLPRPAKGQGILLVSAGGLGDTALFSLLVDRFTRLALPGEAVTLVLRQDAARMNFLLPRGLEVVAIDWQRLAKDWDYRAKTMDDLYRRHYRLAISTDYKRHPDLDEALLLEAGADRTVAMQARPWEKHQKALDENQAALTLVYQSGPPLQDKVRRWCAFADWLTGGEPEPPPRIVLPADRLPKPVELAQPTVIVQPFSALTEKQVGPDFLQSLITAIPDRYGIRIAGHPSDLERNPDYKRLLDMPGVVFDGSSFKDLFPIMRGADLVISVDTAAFHLAALSGVPTLCLASAAFVGEIVPYDPETTPENVRIIHVPMACQGCLGDCELTLIDGMWPCVAQLEPEAAITAALAMLEGIA